MKKIVSIVLVFCLALFAGNVYGQKAQKGKTFPVQKETKAQKAEGEEVTEQEKEAVKAKEGEKEQVMEKTQEGVKEKDLEKEKEMEKAKEADKDAQGNAYGKNKGELEGKEFGQARAADAKTKEGAKPKKAGKGGKNKGAKGVKGKK